MLKIMTFAAVSALALATTVAPQPAQARNNGGAVAAGVIGGLAAGAIIGSQMNRDPGYRANYRECHTERREFEDRYGNIRVRRVRVCD